MATDGITKSGSWQEMLAGSWEAGKFVCVGLDSEYGKIPVYVYRSKVGEMDCVDAISMFNRAIIETTHDLVCAYKFNIAFYEALGDEGFTVLKRTIAYIRNIAPSVPVILDAKRADIGNTNKCYTQAAFNFFHANAITVNPYFGGEALAPFLDRADKGIIVLCRTSNPGADEFQDRIVQITDKEAEKWDLPPRTTMPLYRLVAYRVSREWNRSHNCALVVGATYPEELAEVRQIVGDGFPILIPGIGKQGGDLAKTVKAGKDGHERGMIINFSRRIIFASSGSDFAEAARRETLKLHKGIQQHLKEG